MKLPAWKPQPGPSCSCVSLFLCLQTTVWPLAPMTSLASAPHSLHSVSGTSFRKRRRWIHLGVDEGRDLCSPPPPWGLSGAGCLAQWAQWGRFREGPASGQGEFSALTRLKASGGSTCPPVRAVVRLPSAGACKPPLRESRCGHRCCPQVVTHSAVGALWQMQTPGSGWGHLKRLRVHTLDPTEVFPWSCRCPHWVGTHTLLLACLRGP